jgi:hypothetical protein
MQSFQTYIAELNKTYEFRVKIAGVEPKGEVLDRIRAALDTYQVENISTPKRLPIQEHREFPKFGPCECYLLEVTVAYPTTTAQMTQIIATRGQIDPCCLHVYTKDQLEQEDMVQERIDNQGAVLAEPELKTPAQGDIAGQGRVSSLMKELSARTHEFAAKSEADGKTTNDIPQNTKSVLKPNTTPRGK